MDHVYYYRDKIQQQGISQPTDANKVANIEWGWAWYHELSKPRSELSAKAEG